jgi:hypothetical protein
LIFIIFNVKNSVQLIYDVSELEVNAHTRSCSFDISNIYTNIPQEIVIDIIKTLMNTQETDSGIVIDVISLIELVLEQNYFTHNNSFYKQTHGLAMGAPTFLIFSEIYSICMYVCIYLLQLDPSPVA